MTTAFDLRRPGLRAAAARLFAARTAARDHHAAADPDRGGAGRPPPGLPLSALLAAALDPDPARDAAVRAACRQDPALERARRDLLARHAAAFFETAAAAAADALDERTVAGYRLCIRPSETRPDRAYVIIELADAAAPPPALLEVLPPLDGEAAAAYGPLEPVPLPAPVDGAIQLMRRRDDPLVRALGDHRVQVALR